MNLTTEELHKIIQEELDNLIDEKASKKARRKKKRKYKKKKAKKDACYHKVRSRYDVWPSAYASGALVKCRKVGAKNWGNKSKKNEGLDKPETYYKFKKDIDIIGKNLKNFLDKNKKKHIVAKAFPARASVIIHYFSFIKDHISYIAEQSTSLKLGHYIPGTNIQIINSEKMKKNKPDILIVLAWHLFDPIHKKWLNNGLKRTKFIKPLPKLNIK